MLTTPKDPPGSATSTVDTCSSPVPDEPDPALETARLRREVALLTIRQEIEEARAATATLAQVAAAGERTPRPATDAGTVASWVAHHQLGVAVENIGDAVARALGVVPKAERASMSQAVTDALVKSARDHLGRAAAAEISGVHRSALERACMAALDRQAQLSIDEARRRNSLTDEHDRVDPTSLAAVPEGQDSSAARPIRVLVTDDPLVARSDWRAQQLAAEITAHGAALQRLSAQTAAASTDLETTLDCWVRGAPSGEAPRSAAGERTPTGQWLAQAGIADAAAAIASGVKLLAGAGAGGETGSAGAGSATALSGVTPLTLSLQLLEVARSDLTVSHRKVSTGTHELVVRGAAALATNLGPKGVVIADELTLLDSSDSHLMATLNGLLQQRADLATCVAGLAGNVSFARSLAGLDEAVTGDAAPPNGAAGHDGTTRQNSPNSRPALEPGLRELARQALLHERLVAHVVDCLSTIDRDVRRWVSPDHEGAPPPLLAALGREQLHTGRVQFSHVLVLQDEGHTADVVSRRSIVGDSGRLTHIGSASVSWLLIDADSGAVIEGGQAAPARALTQDTGSGRTSSVSMSPRSTAPLPWDAQHTLELALKFFAVTAGLAALVLSIVALMNIFLN